MIFNFRIVSDEVDNFKREIQIDSTATFLDLKKAICKSVGYDSTQMSSFFLCDRNWEKEKEITFEDMDSDDDEVYIMDESPLDEFIEDEGQKLLILPSGCASGSVPTASVPSTTLWTSPTM